nr:hypothetical protein [Ruania alba]
MNEEREEFEPAGGDRSALRARHSQVEVRFNDVLDEFARLPLDARLAGSVVDTHLLTQLQRLPLFELDPTTLVEVVAAAERVISHVQGLQLQATAALAEQLEMTPPDLADHTRGPADVAGDELSLRLRRPRGQAQTMVRRSRALTTVLTGTGDALTAGLIDLPRAAAIVDGLDGVAWQVAELVEEQVLPARRSARRARCATMSPPHWWMSIQPRRRGVRAVEGRTVTSHGPARIPTASPRSGSRVRPPMCSRLTWRWMPRRAARKHVVTTELWTSSASTAWPPWVGTLWRRDASVRPRSGCPSRQRMVGGRRSRCR